MKLAKETLKASAALVEICQLYEHVDHRHASDILMVSFPSETLEFCQALKEFRITDEDIKAPGGNESTIPKKISNLLRPLVHRVPLLR